nr:MAG TPA: hypothetical protein [Caudoviricetes sp.]
MPFPYRKLLTLASSKKSQKSDIFRMNLLYTGSALHWKGTPFFNQQNKISVIILEFSCSLIYNK